MDPLPVGPLHEKGPTPHDSEQELDDFVHDVAKPDDFDVPVPPDVAVAAPLPDPIMLGKPPWAVGVEFTELAPGPKSMCIMCKLRIEKGGVRSKYWQKKSTFRFVHPECVGELPPAHKAQSCAMLTWQRNFGAGPAFVNLVDKIDVALALLA